VLPVVLNEKSEELAGECEGMLCIKQAWPSTLRTVYGDHERYQTNYFA
jgi:acetyl-CoA synthetase